MKQWRAVVMESPQPEESREDEYREDPQDWEIQLQFGEADTDVYEEVIYVTLTGTCDENGGNVVPTPEDKVDAYIDAMLKGLNSK